MTSIKAIPLGDSPSPATLLSQGCTSTPPSETSFLNMDGSQLRFLIDWKKHSKQSCHIFLLWSFPAEIIQYFNTNEENSNFFLSQLLLQSKKCWQGCQERTVSIDDLICKAEIETQMLRTNEWIPRGKAGQGVGGIGRLAHIHIYTMILCIK